MHECTCIKTCKSTAQSQVGAGYPSIKCQLEAFQRLAAIFLMTEQTSQTSSIRTAPIWIDTMTSGYMERPLIAFTLLWLSFIELFMFGCVSH